MWVIFMEQVQIDIEMPFKLGVPLRIDTIPEIRDDTICFKSALVSCKIGKLANWLNGSGSALLCLRQTK